LLAFYGAPVIGHGWIFSASLQRGNMHSMYFQIACEMGLIGLGTFVLSSLLVFLAAMRSYRFLRQQRALSDLAWLPPSLITGMLCMGLAESSPLMGTTPDTLLLGFAIGLIDQLPKLALVERKKYLSRHRGAPPALGGRLGSTM
jgi:O-antigen ligase